MIGATEQHSRTFTDFTAIDQHHQFTHHVKHLLLGHRGQHIGFIQSVRGQPFAAGKHPVSGIQAIFTALRAKRDGLAFVILPSHDDHAVMLLVDQIVRQWQIIGDDLHRLAAHFATQQESGRSAVDHYAFTRIHKLGCCLGNANFFIVVLRLVKIHWRPARPLLGNSFCAVAYFLEFAAFVELVDVPARSGG
ncbi:hypothetical protein SDC9_192004 [bioreactor metagenome]|uniref:Uncharacterized protein n=1 Tax=bioreactor metagenome TaxID=1076179 RepID=A0A645I1Z8_9ZZZZ